jgi:DNA-directed RNA polymerase specialized sigma24 family protein
MTGRRICAGYYRRYDRKVVYVISLATDADTGEETVIRTTYPFADVPRYYTSSKKSFCAFVEVNGERKAKYKRLLNMKISGEAIERLEDEGFRGPVRKRQRPQPDEAYDSRKYQQADTYYAYAKDLCEHYNFDRNKYRLCLKERRFVAITRNDFANLKEDLQFLDNAMKTVLSEYRDYFRERFVEGLSIRKYAEAHGLNRGSVDYLQKKFFSALAGLLKERDEAEGKCRLRKPVQN